MALLGIPLSLNCGPKGEVTPVSVIESDRPAYVEMHQPAADPSAFDTGSSGPPDLETLVLSLDEWNDMIARQNALYNQIRIESANDSLYKETGNDLLREANDAYRNGEFDHAGLTYSNATSLFARLSDGVERDRNLSMTKALLGSATTWQQTQPLSYQSLYYSWKAMEHYRQAIVGGTGLPSIGGNRSVEIDMGEVEREWSALLSEVDGKWKEGINPEDCLTEGNDKLVRGDEAFLKGDYQAACRHYKGAVWAYALADRPHSVALGYMGMALCDRELGDLKGSFYSLMKADMTTDRAIRNGK